MKRLCMMALMSFMVVPQSFSIMSDGMVALALVAVDGMAAKNPENRELCYQVFDISRCAVAGAAAGFMLERTYSDPKLNFLGFGSVVYSFFPSVMYLCHLFRFVGNPTEHGITKRNYLLKRGLFWTSAMALGIAGSIMAPKLFAKK